MKTKLAVLLIAVVAILASSAANAASSEGHPSKWAKETVSKAIAANLVPDRLQSKYQSSITREEFAELLVQTVMARTNLEKSGDVDWTIDLFLDRVDVNVNFEDTQADYVKVAFAIGAINGVSDTKFSPNSFITRQEAVVMLVNTVHYTSGTAYDDDRIRDIYSDYDQIAKWAQPAVQVAYFVDIMGGVGGKFDYAAKFTREQAISTIWRFYEGVNFHNLTLRGVAEIFAEIDNTHYEVGKDYIYVDYPDEELWLEYGDNLTSMIAQLWYGYADSREYGTMPSVAQAMTVYMFNPLRTYLDEVIKAAYENKSITVDFGYMIYKTLTKDHVIEIKLKPIEGYFTILAGHTYGYPKKEVKPKVLKIEPAAYDSY